MSNLGPRLAGREGERDWRQNITSAVATSNLKYWSEEGRQIAFRRWGTARGPERRQHVPFLTSEIGTCHDDQRLLNIAAIAPRRRQTCYRGLLFLPQWIGRLSNFFTWSIYYLTFFTFEAASQIANDIEYMRLTRKPHRNLRLMRQKEIAITSNYVTFVGYRVSLIAKQLGATELAHFWHNKIKDY